ncbi:bidirectional sugar transporter SWEET3 isoform X2 [Argentina anserina]|uniref:bidirectional sugar transporter SWEET3 isoform X2 n=1 Tax=Argentina anserina TaxID=57926 RepID=UPI00217691AE|nr:bidirectional sugar transporter SWEET3 isoform X2 [Potentilla anserina]
MGERLRLAIGVMGNAASLLLYSTPILTMSRIIRKKNTEEFSCVPYISALLNCLLYTWYGLPVVSCGWENFPVVSINGLGILLEFSFILIYFWFASPTRKMKVIAILIPVIILFCITVSISTFVFNDHHHRKVLVGSLGLVASVTMYGSPLIVVSPNLVGSPLGIFQLLLYCKYRKRVKKAVESPNKWDLEENDEKSNEVQIVIGESANGKS